VILEIRPIESKTVTQQSCSETESVFKSIVGTTGAVEFGIRILFQCAGLDVDGSPKRAGSIGLMFPPRAGSVCYPMRMPYREGQTNQTPWLSGSLTGIPFMVTFMRVRSEPRMVIPVYPTPVPASEVTTTDGVD